MGGKSILLSAAALHFSGISLCGSEHISMSMKAGRLNDLLRLW